ncbi:MAG: ATP synthase F1 subunit gamma [Clostridia bacterium]|nr:ATP synthase F1 subunit gamma [Clostridia bacterium]
MGANTKAIHARMKSVDSTRHITKAMQLVASSKINKAVHRMEDSRFYRRVMLEAFSALGAEKCRYTSYRDRSLPALFVIVAGDRGLAGGYNSQIFRSADVLMKPGDKVLPIGKRAVDRYSRRGTAVSDRFVSAEGFSSAECAAAARIVTDLYDSGEICSVSVISTRFVSMLTQAPDITYLLPLNLRQEMEQIEVKPVQYEFEPSAEAVLDAVIPEYIAGVLYSCTAESYASEVAARRSAMDTATKNADEMMAQLSLEYNRARQSAITQEITEIIAGADAQ